MSNDWKRVVVPIAKPDKNRMLLESYRPITILSCIGKVLERIILSRLNYYLEKNDLLGSYQMGFRAGKGTNDCLHVLKNSIKHSVNSKGYCIVVYLDLQSAFDRVWHKGLIYKLRQLGVGRQYIVWLKGYLKNRVVKVRIGDTVSNEVEVNQGVPQGAVLSPCLFNVMMYDFPHSNHVQTIGYADDITLIVSDTDIARAKQHIQQHLHNIERWVNKWRFKLSIAKCKYQIFTNKRIIPNINIHIHNRNIDMVSKQKVLGVILDSPKLTFNEHIKYVKTKIEKRINVLRSLSATRWGASAKLLRRVYISFIRSKMEYGCVMFGELNETNMRILEVLQNKALRCITGARRTSPILSLECEAYISPIRLRFRYLMLKWYYKYKHVPQDNSIIHTLGITSNPERESPFSSRAQELLQTILEVPIKQRVVTPAVSPIPPTVSLMETISWELPNIIGVQLKSVVNNEFNEHIKKFYPGYTLIYSDGSKLKEGSATAAIYVPELMISTGWSVNSGHTIIGAELIAIVQACKLVIDNHWFRGRKILIYTDSKTALHLIVNTLNPKYKYLVYEIQRLLVLIGLHRIKLQWVKSHIGILGNEVVDSVARRSHNLNRMLHTKMTLDEIWGACQQGFLRYWAVWYREEADRTRKGLFMRNLVDRPVFRLDWVVPRYIECVISRLRKGHVGVASHLNRFNMRDTAMCPVCRQEDSVSHFILVCNRYRNARLKLRRSLEKQHIEWSLKNILGFGEYKSKRERSLIMKALAHYVTETGRLSEL